MLACTKDLFSSVNPSTSSAEHLAESVLDVTKRYAQMMMEGFAVISEQ